MLKRLTIGPVIVKCRGVIDENLHPPVNAEKTEWLFNGGMNRMKITPTLAPAPRLTLWVPLLVAVGLSLIFLAVLYLST